MVRHSEFRFIFGKEMCKKRPGVGVTLSFLGGTHRNHMENFFEKCLLKEALYLFYVAVSELEKT